MVLDCISSTNTADIVIRMIRNCGLGTRQPQPRFRSSFVCLLKLMYAMHLVHWLTRTPVTSSQLNCNWPVFRRYGLLLLPQRVMRYAYSLGRKNGTSQQRALWMYLIRLRLWH